MKINAYAKINLTLELTGEIYSGFHHLKTIMHKTKLHDELEITVNNSGTVSLSCDKNLCDTKDNLVYKAALAYLDEAKAQETLSPTIGLKITLKKLIPDGAGMGGGSADAAAVLNASHTLFGALPKRKLCEIANTLGSDIAFCMSDFECAYCTGRGEHLSKLPPLPPCHMLISKPTESLSTKGIFSEYDDKYGIGKKSGRVYITDKMKSALSGGKLSDICSFVSNDFEELCVLRLPKIQEIKETMLLNGALCASMTGSGSAVFSLFEDYSAALNCKNLLQQQGLFTFLA